MCNKFQSCSMNRRKKKNKSKQSRPGFDGDLMGRRGDTRIHLADFLQLKPSENHGLLTPKLAPCRLLPALTAQLTLRQLVSFSTGDSPIFVPELPGGLC